MERYGNVSGNSPISGYALGVHAITVCFRSGECYVYDGTRPGVEHVQQMQACAIAGTGLATYISRFVRERYACRIHG